MTFKPWDCAQPDEWLPRSLRLCWGSSGSGDSSSGSGWGDTGATTGPGDWGSSGSFDASSFNATGDIGAWAGTAYDASTSGTGAGAAGDWGSFGPTNYSGMNAPNPIFTDIAGPNPGVTTGAGDWGSAGTYSAAGMGGGPGGSLFGSTGAGAGSMYGAGLGGLFGDYGGGPSYDGGGGPAYSGGGGRGAGSGPFGSIGTLAASNTGRGSERSASEPAFADTAGSAGGRGAGQASSGRITSDAPTRSEATIASVVSADPDADPDAPAPDAPAPDAPGNPEPDAPAPEQSAPEASRSDTQSQPSASRGTRGADPEGIDPGSAQYGVFGPESASPQSRDYSQAFQTLSNLTQTALVGPDYEGAPYADMGPQQSNPYAGPFAGPDVVGAARADPFAGRGEWGDLPGIYGTGISNLITGLMSRGPDPQAALDKAVLDAGRGAPAWAQNPRSFELVDPAAGPRAEQQAAARPFGALSTWLSPLNQRTFQDILQGNFLTPAVDPMAEPNWGAVFEGAALPAQDLATQLGFQDVGTQGINPGAEQYSVQASDLAAQTPSTDTTPWGDVFAGTSPLSADLATQLGRGDIDTTPWGSVFEAPAQEPDYASVFEAPAQGSDWASVFEGTPTSPDWTSVFEGAAPALDPRSSIEAFIPGGRETNFEYAPNAPNVPGPTGPDTTMESGPPGEPSTTDNAATPGGDPALSGYPADAAPGAGAGQPGQPGALGQPGSIDPGVSPDAIANAASNTALNVGAPALAGDAASYAAQAAAQAGQSLANVVAAARDAALANDATQEQADAIASAVYNAAVSKAENEVGTTPGAPLTTQTTPTTQTPPPSLVDMAQPSSGRSETAIPGGRQTDFQYVSPAPGRGIEPGAEQYGVEPEDHDAPEPADRSQPEQDPNAPRPPDNIPGQLQGSRGTYQNERADNPRVNRNYLDSGRLDNPQGEPGITFRSARQAGITPLFRTEDINVHDVDAKLVENVNRALRDMEQRTGIPANSLVATSGQRFAHRGGAIIHGMDPRSAQESVRSRGNPSSGGGGFPAAPPGRSNHGAGRALDFAASPARAWLRAHAGEYGLETLGRNFDLPHIQLQRGQGGQRPSEQEQAEQRSINEQNRQAAIDLGLIAPGGRGQQVAGVPMPRGRPGDAEAGIQPGGEQYAGQPLAPQPPTEITNLPPQRDVEPPAPRPPADIPVNIPVQTVPPVVAARTAQAAMQFAKFLADNLGKTGKLPSNREEGQKALTALAQELARAGYPTSVAQKTILETATQGSIKAGYGPNSAYNALGHVTQAINEMAATAMQGYHAGKAPETQGPSAPAELVAPGKRSEAPSLLDFLQNFNPISTAEARGGRSQASQLQAPRADPGTIQSRLSDARSNIIDDLQTNQGLRNTLDLIVTGEVGSQGKAAVLGFLETAMNKVAAEASREGRAPTGRDLLNYLNDRSYFPDTWGKIESGKIKGGALTDDLLGALAAGSNTTKGSTGNSSATSPGSRFDGNPTNATIGKEHYGVENYAHHAAWYNALGAPSAGRGIGSDYAVGPYDAPAVGAMPPQDAAPGMRGLAKGGRVDDDEPVVVGEQGPEVFVPDQPGTIWPHVPQPGLKSTNVDRWPKLPAPDYPGRYGGVEREIKRQTRAAQDIVPGLMDMIDSGRLRLTPNWNAMLNDPALIALGRSRMDDRRVGIEPGAEQYGAFIPAPAPAAEPPDPTNPMAQALGYNSIRRPLRVGRQVY